MFWRSNGEPDSRYDLGPVKQRTRDSTLAVVVVALGKVGCDERNVQLFDMQSRCFPCVLYEAALVLFSDY